MTYTPCPDDKLVPRFVSSCCGAPVYNTNGHSRPVHPEAQVTWWCCCGKCGKACDPVGRKK